MPNGCSSCGNPLKRSARADALLAKFGEPAPKLCFICGQKRRLAFRNGTKLYRRTCDATGESIISMYAPEKPYKVYKTEAWWSDSWDPRSYSRDVDFNRPFFGQFRELQLHVPRLALIDIKSENSPYCNMSMGNKNCYLICGGDFNQDCMYGVFGMHNKSVTDCDSSNHNERCYALFNSFTCYDSQYIVDSQNCNNCAFVSDCIGCTDCILCTNLRKKSYCIRNVQYSKDDYEREKATLLAGSYKQQQDNWREFLDLRSKRIVKYANILSSEDCVGDYISGSKNCDNCFDAWDCEDMADVILGSKAKDAYCSGCVGERSSLCYDMQSPVGSYEARHSYAVFDSSFIEYCDFVGNSRNLFGCSNMRGAKYCILNKQYSEEEFKALRGRLIEHMKKTNEYGEFFPPECSCFAYNESTAHEYFPLTKDEALAQGFTWSETPERIPEATKSVPAARLPDAIGDIPDDIINWAIESEQSGRPFKIIKQELEFYRAHNLPVPHLHPDERHALRMTLKNPLQLWERKCAKCSEDIKTSYAPDRSETVVCEDCYLKEVY